MQSKITKYLKKHRLKNTIEEYTAVFGIGGAGYSLIEILWRGFTHWTMALTGGICLTLLYAVQAKGKHDSLIKKCAKSAMVITAVEFTVGIIVNKVFQMDVWDYSKMRFNIMGQVCLLYSFLWFLLSFPVTALTSFLRKRL